MNITLGVALVTALSTLSAGALASYTSLRIYRRQVSAQREITVFEQTQRQNTERRQLRRDAYVGFLAHCDTILNALPACWFEKAPSTPNPPQTKALFEVKNLLDSADTPMNTVLLEGPEDVIDAATELFKSLHESFMKICEFRNNNIGVDDTILGIAKKADYETYTTIYNAKDAFINIARNALGTSSSTQPFTNEITSQSRGESGPSDT